jgi:type IV secretory pathway VirJ component
MRVLPSFLLVPSLLAFLASAVCARAENASVEALSDPMFGEILVFAPVEAPHGVIAFLSDDSGFGREETTLAESFRARGQLVVGLSWPSWRRHVAAQRKESCHDLLGHVENLVANVERERRIAPYLTPVLAGLGLGGAAATALAPETATHRIAGVVALASSSSFDTDSPICGTVARRHGAGWVYETPRDPAQASLRELDREDEAAAGDAVDTFQATAGPHGPGELSDLPLFVAAPQSRTRRLAVVLSGDGGMGALDKGLMRALSSRGILVAALDSRRYFWSERDPASVAHDLQRIMRHFRRESPIERVALVGYSYGAEALSLAYRRLSPKAKRYVGVVSLLSVAPATNLKVELRDEDYTNSVPLLADAARIDAPKVQCVYGENDPPAAYACPALGFMRPDVEVTRTTGGHAFDGDVERIADIIAGPLLLPVPSAPSASPRSAAAAP